MFDKLPEYPWQQLKPFAARAAQHPQGAVDLSVGSPIDPTPQIIQDALAQATNAPGYPATGGSPEFRAAVVEWFARRRGVPGLLPEQVMPTIGSKELISWLPLLLGLGPGDAIVQPRVAYTAYVVGAALCGAQIVSTDDPAEWPSNTKLVWLNSPGNPDGRVLDVDSLRASVIQARKIGAVVASDECYAELGWGRWQTELIPSVLDPRVAGDSHAGLLAVYSLSKQSNLAGYRAAFVAGDAALIKGLVNLRMHSGLNTPAPVQRVMTVALGDHQHVQEAHQAYGRRREALLPAVREFGFELAESEAGLYLWATLHEDCWATVARMAELGIVVVPGSFYGAAGGQFVRFSLTATDQQVETAALRLREAARVNRG